MVLEVQIAEIVHVVYGAVIGGRRSVIGRHRAPSGQLVAAAQLAEIERFDRQRRRARGRPVSPDDAR